MLFSDIRGFTTFSEKYQPEEVVSQLNEYLGAMTEEGGRDLIDRLNEAYHPGAGRYTGDDGTENVRVVVRITPDKVVFRG